MQDYSSSNANMLGLEVEEAAKLLTFIDTQVIDD